MLARWGLLAFSSLLPVACGGGGGGGGSSCRPSPAITSSPPRTATVGAQYRYVIDSRYYCLLGVCSSVEERVLPPGAQLVNGAGDFLVWTLQPADADKDVSFRIVTSEDFCGDRATQCWRVHVYPAPVVASFTASPGVIPCR